MGATADDIARDIQRRKAAIRRAERAALRQRNELMEGAVRQARDAFRRSLREIDATLRRLADEDNRLRLKTLQPLREQLRERLGQLDQRLQGILREGRTQAAVSAAQAMAPAVAEARLTGLADEAVTAAGNFIEDDGLQLSDRIWRMGQSMDDAVIPAVQSAIIQGHSAERAALDFVGGDEALPAELRDKMARARADRISGAIGRRLVRGDGSPFRQAKRLFRTEIARAHKTAFESAAFEVEDTVGTKFNLSPNHPRRDICDMHATVNRHGLGAGVYPKGKNPFPAHPETISFTTAVFQDEVTEADREKKEDRIAWLKRQTPQTQVAVLRSTKKRAALVKGHLTEGMIASPWRAVERRLRAKGIDTDNILGGLPPPSGLGETARPAGRGTVGAALDIREQKRAAEHVSRVIDDLHGDGKLPRVPIKTTRGRALGAYRYIQGSGRPVDIRVKRGSQFQELTLAHEIGHFLDHQGVGRAGRYASESDDMFAGWRQAVSETAVIRRLRDLASRRTVEGTQVPRAHVNNLLATREVWARSYAQWVALRSNDRTLGLQLDAMLRRETQARLYVPQQWRYEEFEPVAREIDKLLRRLGWVRDGD